MELPETDWHGKLGIARLFFVSETGLKILSVLNHDEEATKRIRMIRKPYPIDNLNETIAMDAE